MSEPLLVRTELDAARCQHPGCDDCGDEIELHSHCHPREPPWAVYHKGGELELLCSVCEDSVARIAVAG